MRDVGGSSDGSSHGLQTGRVAVCLLVVAVLAGGVVAPLVAAADAASVVPDPKTPGATSTHTAKLTVSSDSDINNFDYFRVDYAAEESATSVSNVTKEDIVRFGVDTDGDGSIEKSLATGDWSVSHGSSGHTLRVRNQDWDGKLEPGDVIILEYRDVQNPSEDGTYVVDLILNGQQDERITFDIGSGSSSSPTSTNSPTPTPTEAASGGGSGGGGSGGGGSGGSGDTGGSASGSTTDTPTATESASGTSSSVVTGTDDDDDDDTATVTIAGEGSTDTEAAMAAQEGGTGATTADGGSGWGWLWLAGAGLLLALLGATWLFYRKMG